MNPQVKIMAFTPYEIWHHFAVQIDIRRAIPHLVHFCAYLMYTKNIPEKHTSVSHISDSKDYYN